MKVGKVEHMEIVQGKIFNPRWRYDNVMVKIEGDNNIYLIHIGKYDYDAEDYLKNIGRNITYTTGKRSGELFSWINIY